MKSYRFTAFTFLIVWVAGGGVADAIRTTSWLAAQIDFTAHDSTPAYQYAYLAARQGDLTAPDLIVSNAVAQQDRYWLRQLANLDHPEAIYQLALIQHNAADKLRLLRRSALLNHGASQHELGLLSRAPHSQLLWLEKAANNQYVPAYEALYNWYQLHGQTEAGLQWLRKAALHSAKNALKLARLLWRQNERDEALQLFNLAAESGNSDARQYVKLIGEHREMIKDVAQMSPASFRASSNQHCAMTLQFVASSLESYKQAKAFYARFTSDQRLQSLPICTDRPIWLETMHCEANWQGNKRLGCDLRPLITLAQRTDFSHAVVFAEQGKANVHNGIMYLDLADPYTVFVHELAHFAGFVDEYPLSSTMARYHCGNRGAPNLRFKSKTEKNAAPATSGLNEWDDNDHSVFKDKARTCNNSDIQAYKPVSELTFLEYHDHGSIPALYLSMWAAQLQQRNLLTPVYVNFAQYLQQKGQFSESQRWRHKYSRFIGTPLTNPS